MNLFSRIAVGTANFGKEYNGVKVPEKDIEKILGYCQCSGIDTLDCATAYGWDWTQANSYFKKIVKVRKGDDIDKVIETEPYCIMIHDMKDINARQREIKDKGLELVGYSIYDFGDFTTLPHYFIKKEMDIVTSIIQLPYSLYDRRFETTFAELKNMCYEIHVRSIFLRGRIIEDGISPEECIKFCLANPHIDKVIIGVDSFVQLQRNLDFLHKWKNLEKHDEKLLDTRKWKRNVP